MRFLRLAVLAALVVAPFASADARRGNHEPDRSPPHGTPYDDHQPGYTPDRAPRGG